MLENVQKKKKKGFSFFCFLNSSMGFLFLLMFLSMNAKINIQNKPVEIMESLTLVIIFSSSTLLFLSSILVNRCNIWGFVIPMIILFLYCLYFIFWFQSPIFVPATLIYIFYFFHLKVKRIFFLVPILFYLSSVSVYSEEWLDESKTPKMEKLLAEVSMLNLINGIYLTEQQIIQIITLSKESKKEYARYRTGMLTLNHEAEQILVDLKIILEANQEISPDVQILIEQKEKEIKSYTQHFYSQIKLLEKKLEKVLSPAQQHIIQGFQPCIIPPRDFSNPIRVGQSSSNLAEIENFLSLIRGLSVKAYRNLAFTFIEEMITGQEQHLGPLSVKERKAEEQRLFSVLNEARTMTDVDFALQKGKLAKDIIKRFDDLSDTYDDFMQFASQLHGGLTKTGKYFLDPQMIPLLEKRLLLVQKGEIHATQKGDTPDQLSNQDHLLKSKKKKMSMEEFSLILKLNQSQHSKAWQSIHQGKQEAWQLFVLSRRDGVNIINEIKKLEVATLNDHEKYKRMLELLSLDVPGTHETYFDRLNDIKKRIERNLKNIFTEHQFNKYKIIKIDLLDIEE